MSETVTCASCVNLDMYGWCEKIADSPHTDTGRYCEHHQTATKADIIRRMKDAELARFLCDITGSCRNCIAKRCCGAGQNGYFAAVSRQRNDVYKTQRGKKRRK